MPLAEASERGLMTHGGETVSAKWLIYSSLNKAENAGTGTPSS